MILINFDDRYFYNNILTEETRKNITFEDLLKINEHYSSQNIIPILRLFERWRILDDIKDVFYLYYYRIMGKIIKEWDSKQGLFCLFLFIRNVLKENPDINLNVYAELILNSLKQELQIDCFKVENKIYIQLPETICDDYEIDEAYYKSLQELTEKDTKSSV